MKFYLGLDESGTGGFPVFHVAALTGIKEDVMPWYHTKPPYIPGESAYILGVPFAFVMVREEDADVLGTNNMNLIARAELIRYYARHRKIEKTLIDGEMDRRSLDTLTRILWIKHSPRIRTGDHFDQIYGAVNKADWIARILRGHWINNKGAKEHRLNGYLQHMITPRLERYQQLLRPENPPDMRPNRTSKGFVNRGHHLAVKSMRKLRK